MKKTKVLDLEFEMLARGAQPLDLQFQNMYQYVISVLQKWN